MSPIQRFYRQHLKAYLPGTIGGGVLLSMASSLQALSIGLIMLVFDEELNMGAGGKMAPLQSFTRHLVDSLPIQEGLRHSLWLLPACIVFIFFLRGCFIYAGSVMVAKSGMKAVRDLRVRLFDQVLIQDPPFFQRYPVGQLMNRVLGDVGAVQQVASTQVSEIIKQVSMAVAMTIALISHDWRMPVFVAALFPLVFLPVKRISKRIRSVGHRTQKSADMLLQRLKEVLSNMRVVKAFAREDYESRRFRDQSQDLYRMGVKVVRSQALSSPIMEIVGGLLLALLIYYGASEVHAHRMTGGAFLGLLLIIYQLYDPIRSLTKIYAEMQSSSVALERIFTLLDTQPVLVAPERPAPLPDRPSKLAFEHVAFSYDQNHQVLRGIDLTVRRGETVALVGSSGGGKTTMANLVPRFFDPTEGRLTLDGTDLRDFDPRELRKRIGVVTQETLLFMDSIHDNIAYGKEASREAVIQAAKRAHAHDFIAALANGYDTPLAETGSSLSGGQRQRLAIARALLQDPPILVLDEATSALDTESERAVQAALEELMKDRTTIVIAHRLSTIQRATRICALKHGQIVEQGTHDELLAKGGEYARLHALQFQDA
ncbi:MAG TPA: ABC transporter ATP-binding protein [Holophagaceae bacterium]|jgi:subfamily B ATP-binding cassette protein MsbA|nr:ABC transporter ATP-binding protein [Holophagaceae bacterium]